MHIYTGALRVNVYLLDLGFGDHFFHNLFLAPVFVFILNKIRTKY